MRADYLCRYTLPELGGVLAVSVGAPFYKVHVVKIGEVPPVQVNGNADEHGEPTVNGDDPGLENGSNGEEPLVNGDNSPPTVNGDTTQSDQTPREDKPEHVIEGIPIFSIGGKDDRGRRMIVKGQQWCPYGICYHGNHLYLGDGDNGRVLVIDATTGSIIQALRPPQLASTNVIQTSWCHTKNVLNVTHFDNNDGKWKISQFKINKN